MYIVSNKAKGRISKPWFQEKKKFPKTKISPPPLVWGKEMLSEVKNIRFWTTLRTLFSSNNRFEIHSFALLPTMIKYRFHTS